MAHSDTAVAPTPQQLRTARKAVISSSIGAALEWFDIIVYASFAVVIARVFFPDDDPLFGLIATFATFFITYLIRPIGGLFLGGYADRHGRKNALSLTLLLMMFGTLLLAIAPPIPFWGAVIVLVSRLIQGFSAGGEFGTATTFLVETAPNRKHFYASWQVASQGVSMLMASAFGFVLTTQLSTEALDSWGWRVPFFVGLLIGPVGLYIRARMAETDEFLDMKKKADAAAIDDGGAQKRSAVATQLASQWTRVLAGAAAVGVATLSVYLILYMPTFAVTDLGVPASAAFLGGVVSGIITLTGAPLVGNLADRIGPVRIMTWTAVATVVLAYPIFALVIAYPTVPVLVLAITLLGIILVFYFAPLPGLMTSLFPTAVRGSGMSLAYNLGVTCLGSIAPLVLTWLLGTTGVLAAPSYYYIVVALISLTGLWVIRTKFGLR